MAGAQCIVSPPPLRCAAALAALVLCLSCPGAPASVAAAAAAPNSAPDDDLNPGGTCAVDIASRCQHVARGRARLVDCILAEAQNDRLGNSNMDPVSGACSAWALSLRAEMFSNLTRNPDLMAACAGDIRMHCSSGLAPAPGEPLACLRRVKTEQRVSLGDECRAVVFRAQLAAAMDLRADAKLNEHCAQDALRLCNWTAPGEGHTQDCLRRGGPKVRPVCRAELFRQEVENAGDMRLHPRLQQACANDQARFCAGVEEDGGRGEECLESHRLHWDFSPDCATELELHMERRATHWRLDFLLRTLCHRDSAKLCGEVGEGGGTGAWGADEGGRVLRCLQASMGGIQSPECRARVRVRTQQEAQNIRLNTLLVANCHVPWVFLPRSRAVRGKWRKRQKSGPSRASRAPVSRVLVGAPVPLLYLQQNLTRLVAPCRSALFQSLLLFSTSVEFKFPLMRACTRELAQLCTGIPHDDPGALRCLQDAGEEAGMSQGCRAEVDRDLEFTSSDFRLHPSLNRACSSSVPTLCSGACVLPLPRDFSPCALQCLQEREQDIQSEECRTELAHFNALILRDPLRFNAALRRDCGHAPLTLCLERPPLPSLSSLFRTPRHAALDYPSSACLQHPGSAFSRKCRRQVTRVSSLQASDIRLSPALAAACGAEFPSLCKGTAPEGAEALKCLKQHLGDWRMGTPCARQVAVSAAWQPLTEHRRNLRLSDRCARRVVGLLKDDPTTTTEAAAREGRVQLLTLLASSRVDLPETCRAELAFVAYLVLGGLRRECYWNITDVCNGFANVVSPRFTHCLLQHLSKPSTPARECVASVSLLVLEDGRSSAGGGNYINTASTGGTKTRERSFKRSTWMA